MPVPLSPYDGPWTFAASWAFALMLGNDRAQSHHTKQRIQWDAPSKGWRISDVSEG